MPKTILKRGHKIAKSATPALVFIAFIFILLRYAAEVKEAILSAISLSVNVILPSLIPFMILSDYLGAAIKLNKKSPLSRLFEAAFGISSAALPAFICGCICGFPLGIKSGAELYADGLLSRDEFERLSIIANNPSLAFTVSAVGIALRGSFAEGILLYAASICAAIIVGVFFRGKSGNFNIFDYKQGQKFDLSTSIRSAGFASVSISSYIIFFSALLSVVRIFVKSGAVLLIISPLIEVSSACNLLASTSIIPRNLSLVFTAFALGFSGFSVHMQGFSFMPLEISRRRYIMGKLLVGIIAAAFVVPFSFT